MRIAFWPLGIVLSMAAAGCSIHPIPTDVPGRNATVDIVSKIRCEAKRAIELHDPDNQLKNAAISYDFKFTITEANDAGASADFGLPFTRGTFTLGIGAAEERERVGERTFIVIDYFQEARDLKTCSNETKENWRYPITGVIGLEETIGTFITMNRSALLDPLKKAKPKKKKKAPGDGDERDKDGKGTKQTYDFTDTLQFTTTVRGSASPKIELKPVGSGLNLTKAGVSLAAERTDKHRVVIGLIRPEPSYRGYAIGPGGSTKDRALQLLYRQRQMYINDSVLETLRSAPSR